ncbi:MAG: peptidase M2 family protein, partial [Alphaproteobacteria bacterium]
LYEDLHCYVRDRLIAYYGDAATPVDGRIPAHLLGNMWSQSWNNVFDLVAPYPDAPSVDPTARLKAQNYDHIRMVRLGEKFFTSLGFDPLPDTFWERSLFTQPADREVVCHASAWHMDFGQDIRLKMCIRPTYEDLVTIHHELGHSYYQRAYSHLPVLYQSGAHDGFHEAIGDAIALSMTPAYLKSIGLAETASTDHAATINTQMQLALDKIAFLPFAKLMDNWRWGVFSGDIGPDEYNSAWWRLRRAYQGIEPPVARTEDHFDPGAKYHIPGNTPYVRYFLSFILQFQFHKALCEAAGWEGPLHECSIYGSKEAGAKLNAMLMMGQSRPWREALHALTGTKEMDAGALLEYFAPLSRWLEQENQGRQCGWSP